MIGIFYFALLLMVIYILKSVVWDKLLSDDDDTSERLSNVRSEATDVKNEADDLSEIVSLKEEIKSSKNVIKQSEDKLNKLEKL